MQDLNERGYVMTTHILLIEDDRNLREAVQSYMLRHGHRVTACASISEAREVMVHVKSAIAPDTVVSDVRLPDGNGAEFYVEQSRRFPGINWVLMSGDPDLVHLSRQLAKPCGAGGCAVVEKPLSLGLLERFVALHAESNGTAVGTSAALATCA
jgi:two-component system nitrogen regulation response regulator GlnG